MKIFSLPLTLLLSLSVAVPQQEVHQDPALMNEDVLKMLQAGLSAEIVVAKIEHSQCRFDTSPNVLRELKQEGVSDTVILAMIEAGEDSVRAAVATMDESESYSKDKPIRVRVDSEEPNLGIELLGSMQKEGTKRGLSLLPVKDDESYHIRIAIIGERSLAGAQTGAVILTPNCDVLTAVIRSGRWSKSGAARAVGKQLAKDLAAMAEIGELSKTISP